jgi:hypothetical protein
VIEIPSELMPQVVKTWRGCKTQDGEDWHKQGVDMVETVYSESNRNTDVNCSWNEKYLKNDDYWERNQIKTSKEQDGSAIEETSFENNRGYKKTEGKKCNANSECLEVWSRIDDGCGTVTETSEDLRSKRHTSKLDKIAEHKLIWNESTPTHGERNEKHWVCFEQLFCNEAVEKWG